MKKLLVGLLAFSSLSTFAEVTVSSYDDAINIPDNSLYLTVKKDLNFLARSPGLHVGHRCGIRLAQKLASEGKVSVGNVIKISTIRRTKDSTAYNYNLYIKNYNSLELIDCHDHSPILVHQLKNRLESEYFDVTIKSDPIELD